MIRPTFAACIATFAALAAIPAQARDTAYPHIPEPMVFDLVRGMGARRGELEANVLATSPLSGQDRVLEWAPEIEYAPFDNFAVEFELPFENAYLAEVKLGLQGTFGAFDGGRGVHGVQYLGIYDRHDGSMSHALLYMVGRRHSERWSTLSMVGVGDVRVGQPERVAGLLVNHSTFYALGGERTAGLEVNYKSGPDGGLLLMPQYHAPFVAGTTIQFGFGADKQRRATARPVGALRVIAEF